MAIQHQVWFKFPDSVPAERVQKHLDGLKALRTQVPGIIDLNLGKNFTDRANGFTHGLLVTLRDKQALDAYAVHPKHVEVATAIRADGQVMALDYEF